MANVNGTEINLTPTEGMKTEAERYRKWKSEGEAGGTEVAARRATQILSGNELSPDVVVEMSAWFASCLLYTSPSPRDQRGSRMPSSA